LVILLLSKDSQNEFDGVFVKREKMKIWSTLVFVWLSFSLCFCQSYDHFFSAYDFSLGGANLNSKYPTIQNPASFVSNNPNIISANYNFFNRSGETFQSGELGNTDNDLNIIDDRDFIHTLIILKYNWLGIYYRQLKYLNNIKLSRSDGGIPNYINEIRRKQIALGIVIAFKIYHKVNWGVNLKYVEYSLKQSHSIGNEKHYTKDNAVDFSVGINYLLSRRFSLSAVIDNLIQGKIKYGIHGYYWGRVRSDKLARRLDIGMKYVISDNIQIYYAMKDLLKYDSNTELKYFLSAMTWHLGLSINYKNSNLNFGSVLESKSDEKFAIDNFYKFFNIGFGYEIKHLQFIFAYGLNNLESKNSFNYNDLSKYSESVSGPYLFSIRYVN